MERAVVEWWFPPKRAQIKSAAPSLQVNLANDLRRCLTGVQNDFHSAGGRIRIKETDCLKADDIAVGSEAWE